jgi:hypothetical protein
MQDGQVKRAVCEIAPSEMDAIMVALWSACSSSRH